MAYKHLFIGRGNAVLHELAKECLRRGCLPASDPLRKLASAEKSGWYLRSVGPLNAEIARLEQLLLGAPSESHRTNTSPPGPLPATGAPPSVPNPLATGAAVAIRHLAATPESGIDLETLSALIDSTWGRGMSANLTQRPIELTRGLVSPEDQRASTINEAAASRLVAALEANAKRQIAEQCSPEAQAEDFRKLTRFCQRAGVRIPGLSYRGTKPIAAGGETLEPQSLAIAQRRVNAFIATLEGQEVSTDPDVVQSARKFFTKVTGRPYTVGETLKPLSGRPYTVGETFKTPGP
jgi:hypothetical protein